MQYSEEKNSSWANKEAKSEERENAPFFGNWSKFGGNVAMGNAQSSSGEGSHSLLEKIFPNQNTSRGKVNYTVGKCQNHGRSERGSRLGSKSESVILLGRCQLLEEKLSNMIELWGAIP